MADFKVPYPEAGLAAFEALDNYSSDFLISGSWPELAPGRPRKVKANQVLRQFEVVGQDANGDLVPAKLSATAVKATGVCSQAVTGAADGSTTVDVLESGCFNPDALTWDASYDTAAKKAVAFDGAPTPTTILIRARG